jgi:hypothetical protein
MHSTAINGLQELESGNPPSNLWTDSAKIMDLHGGWIYMVKAIGRDCRVGQKPSVHAKSVFSAGAAVL